MTTKKNHGLKNVLNYVRVNYSSRLRVKTNRKLIEKIRFSTDKVWITTPYFVPDSRLIDALTSASARHVDVRILVPYRSDHALMTWIAAKFYKDLLSKNIKIFEFKPTILHAKTMIVDDWAIIGSSNINSRSFFHDLEADVILKESLSLQKMEKQFLMDQKQSTTITLLSIKNQKVRWILGNIFFVFRHWL